MFSYVAGGGTPRVRCYANTMYKKKRPLNLRRDTDFFLFFQHKESCYFLFFLGLGVGAMTSKRPLCLCCLDLFGLGVVELLLVALDDWALVALGDLPLADLATGDLLLDAVLAFRRLWTGRRGELEDDRARLSACSLLVRVPDVDSVRDPGDLPIGDRGLFPRGPWVVTESLPPGTYSSSRESSLISAAASDRRENASISRVVSESGSTNVGRCSIV
jgi:hypothetical protein